MSISSPQQFTYEVSGLSTSQTIKSVGSSFSYMFIISLFLSIAVSIATGDPIDIMWSMANTLQILYYLSLQNLYYSSDLLQVFLYMKYSNFDNEGFQYIREKMSSFLNFINSSLPTGFEKLGYSSSSVLVNLYDKLIMILMMLLLVVFVQIIYRYTSNKNNKFANIVKNKDIELRYESVSRFFWEIVLNLSVVNWINFAYGNFYNIFNGISYVTTIILTNMIIFVGMYWIIYPLFYHSEILKSPEAHKRHKFLFSEFNVEKYK